MLAAGATTLAVGAYGMVSAGLPQLGASLALSSSTKSTAKAPRAVPTPPKPTNPAPANPNGDGGKTPIIQWKATGAKAYVAYSIDYVVDQVNAKPNPTWYWATQMGFQKGDAFYMGLQPDFGQKTRALFSVFGPGTTPLASTCNAGADGGSGTSCSIQYDWKVGNTYRLTVTRVGANASTSTWRGTIKDLSTHVTTQIGKWSVLASRGMITPGNISWSEWFGGNIPCSQRTKNAVYFRHPIGVGPGGRMYREQVGGVTSGTCAGFTPVKGWVLVQAGS
jgi:Domain of unknown function (DUF3472)